MEDKKQKIFTHEGRSQEEYLEMIRYFEDPSKNENRIGTNIPYIEEYNLIGDAGQNSMYGHLPKRFVRFPKSEFSHFLEEIKKDDCSYVSYLDHNDVKKTGEFVGENLSVLLKRIGFLTNVKNSSFTPKDVERWTAINNENKQLIGSEIVGSRILNYFDIKTVYNKALIQEFTIYLLSVDFIKLEQNLYPLEMFESYNEMDSYRPIKDNIRTFNSKLDGMLRFIYKNQDGENIKFDRKELEEEYVKSYLVRVLLLKDSDFKAENVGLIYDKEENKISYGPNFDFEYLFRKLAHVAGFFHKYQSDIDFIYSNYPEIMERFVQKLKDLLKTSYRKKVSDLDVILINDFDKEMFDKFKTYITENAQEFLEAFENVKSKHKTNE